MGVVLAESEGLGTVGSGEWPVGVSATFEMLSPPPSFQLSQRNSALVPLT